MNNLPIQTYESVVQQRDALEKKLADMAAEHAGLRKFLQESCYVYDGDGTDVSDSYTPASESKMMPTASESDLLTAQMKENYRTEGAHFVANRMLAAWDAGFIDDTTENAADIAQMILTATEFMADAPEGDFDRSFADSVLDNIAAQLRKGINDAQ